MFNWIRGPVLDFFPNPGEANLVIYQAGSAIRGHDQAFAFTEGIILSPVTCRAPSFAVLDVWLYFCGFDTAGNGTFQATIFDGENVDKAFRAPPVITSWTAVDGGAGQCTQGQHFIGFVYQNRTGYSGVPVTGITYAITAATNASPSVLNAPGNNLQNGQTVTITGALGNTAVNGARIVQNVSGSTFTLTDTNGNQINGNGVYSGSGTVTNPIQITTQAGLRQINVSVGLPAMPDGGTSANGGVQATLFLIATRADNPALWYFIPNDAQTGQVGEQPVPINNAQTYNFVFSLSDEDIAASLAGDTAQKNFFLLAQDANGDGPFFDTTTVPPTSIGPNFVAVYGKRMCYGTGTTLYVSDIDNAQQIAADTNAVRMPNQRLIGSAFQLPGNPSFYLTGDRWTGYVTDNSDSPSTWGEPILVSDALGAQYPDCVCAVTGGNYVWIVTESGPYYFDGQFTANQLLYLITGYDENQAPTGWNRVNWNAAYAIQVRDDVANLKLYVAVPLDGATECNYMFVIDYRMGKTFETVDIGIDRFTPQTFSSIAVVKEATTGRTNLWKGPSEAGSVVRFDPLTHNDLDLAIQCIWQSGLVRGDEMQTTIVNVGYLDIWARGHAPLVGGNSTFGLAVISLDEQSVITPDLQGNMGVPAALVESPGIMYSAKFDLSMVPNYTVAFQTDAIDSWFELSSFTAWQKAGLTNR